MKKLFFCTSILALSCSSLSAITFYNNADQKVRVMTTEKGEWVQPGKSLTISGNDRVWATKDHYPYSFNIKCPLVSNNKELTLDKDYKCDIKKPTH